MAAIWLDRDEVRDLPPVCMVCGAEATTTSRQTFRWHPPWVIVLIIAGLLIWAIVAIILTKTMTVQAPVCDEHKGHWFKRKLIGWLAVLLGLAALFGGIVVMASVGNDPRYRDLAALGPLGGAVSMLLGLIVAVVAFRSAIRPLEISNDDIRLTGVHAEFIEAVREDRRVQDQREEERRRKRRESGDVRRGSPRYDEY